jgi:regulator of sigma E protease
LLITIIAFLLVFTGVILAHELGHFSAAKLSKVKVEEFGLGYPPRLYGKKLGETIYSINALPFGGFTRLSGEEDPKAHRSLASKSRLTRVFVLGAGALVNALLPVLLFIIAFMVPHQVATGQIQIVNIASGSPAAATQLMSGDIIVAINGQPISSFDDISAQVTPNLGKQISITVQEPSGQQDTVYLVPRQNPPQGEGAMGIQSQMLTATKSEPFWRAIPLGFKETINTFVAFKNAIFSLFAGSSQLQFTGPVGIAELTGQAAQAGFSVLLQFTAFLSLNLAIINILPLPALDGGRIVFVIIEWFRRGKRISPKVEGMVHMIGFVLLIGLAILVTYNDIARLISGQNILP